MDIELHRVFIVHHLGASATGLIAHFSSSLDCVTPPVNVKLASSSRLARKPEKCTLKPVQLPFLGLFDEKIFISNYYPVIMSHSDPRISVYFLGLTSNPDLLPDPDVSDD